MANHDAPACVHTDINTLAPISNLPPEILTKVFLYNAGYCSGYGQEGRCLRAMGHWILVTHVCTYWREIALQCTELWSHLHVPALPGILDVLLSRSRDAPLSMCLQFWSVADTEVLVEPEEDALLLGLSALHRVRTLCVNVNEIYDPTTEFLERLGSRAPLLESLHIDSAFSSTNLAALRATISRMLSHPDTCTLRSFDTDICCVDWTNTPFHGLTCLSVRREDKSSETSIQSLLKALDCMPCLEELWLEGVSEEIQDVTQILPSPITIPRLQRLHILYEDQLFTGELLNSLDTPSLRALDIAPFKSELTDDSAPLVAAMSQKTATLVPFLTLAYGSCGQRFSAYRDVFQHTAEPKDDSTLEWYEQHRNIVAMVVDANDGLQLISSMPLRETTTLILNGGFPAHHEWLSLTRGMESVTELRWYYGVYDEHKLAKRLSLRHQDLGDGRTLFVLPNLDTITLDRLTFSSNTHRLGTTLADCFAQRALEAAAIKTLRILHAQNFFKVTFESLREVVPYVETDGELW
ncbi:hypothetical protein C8Q72DRAFT_153921 [Fomitopsis betulina]|nr:hypothetical protein C8Q72DRAFT_153921 [Fomitopsis betulina]